MSGRSRPPWAAIRAATSWNRRREWSTSGRPAVSRTSERTRSQRASESSRGRRYRPPSAMGSNSSRSRWRSIRGGCLWRIVIAVPRDHRWCPYGSYPYRDSATPTALPSTNCPSTTSRPPSPVSRRGTSDSMHHALHESLPATAANQGAVVVCLLLPREDYRFVFATDQARFCQSPSRAAA